MTSTPESTGYLQWICFTVCCKNLTCCSQLQTYLRLVALTLHVIKGYLHPGKYRVFTVSLFPCFLPHGTICVFLKIIEWPPKFTLIKITMKTWRRLVRCIKNFASSPVWSEWQLLHWPLAIYTTVTMHCENSQVKHQERTGISSPLCYSTNSHYYKDRDPCRGQKFSKTTDFQVRV